MDAAPKGSCSTAAPVCITQRGVMPAVQKTACSGAMQHSASTSRMPTQRSAWRGEGNPGLAHEPHPLVLVLKCGHMPPTKLAHQPKH
jgi:hypothetical protein